MASMNLDFDSVPQGTNIKDIKVPDHLRVRVDTGFDFLNFVLSGDAEKQGFTPTTALLFTGTPGAGKSTLALQIADAAVGNGHEALVNSGEESIAQLAMTAERLGLENGFTVGNDVFVDRPESSKKDAAAVKQTLRENVEFMLKRVRAKNARRSVEENKSRLVLIIDSLQCMNDGKWGFASNSKTPLRVAQELTQMAKDNEELVVIVIGQVGKSGVFKGDNQLLHTVDAHLHLYVDEDEKSDTRGCRVLECRKNRFGPSGIAVSLDIGRRGLREYRTRRPTDNVQGMRI